MFEKILKGARSGHPGAGGVKGVSHKNAPLAGHPYHQKTTQELQYIIADANEAAKNMRGWNDAAESKYLDQVNDASTVLGYRRRNNLSDIEAIDAAKKFQDKITKKSEGFVEVLKGARRGQPGAGGVKHPGMKQKNTSTGDWKNVPTEQLRVAIGAFAPHAASSEKNKEVAAAMVKELGVREGGSKEKSTDEQFYLETLQIALGVGSTLPKGKIKEKSPDDDLVSVGTSWNGGDGSKEKMHAIPKPPSQEGKRTNPVKGGKEYAALASVLGDPTETAHDGQKAYFQKDYSKKAGPAAANKLHTALSKLGFTGKSYDSEGNPTSYTKMGVIVDVTQGETKSGYRVLASVVNLGLIGASKKNEGWRGFFGI